MATTNMNDVETAQDLPKVLFIKDIMRDTQLSREIVTKAILSGELPAYKFGSNKNKYRVRRGDYLRWLEAHRVANDESGI